ncbi:zinc ribbon domain-containing protein [Paenibacillus gorillae]|uniref:zinc ribbon domain-containing protein n=1 Tax=Paenibacillus gorillae TaxID=1243662 RepID=UPI0004AF6E28
MKCPWCHEMVELRKDGSCPECKNEVNEEEEGGEEQGLPRSTELIDMIQHKFHCAKCGDDECEVKEVAMTGTGLSKLFDIQYNHYLFVSCCNCGFVEVYNPDIIRGSKTGSVSTVLDIIFGR